MATIVFYEKPGCGNNTKQKVWLAASGHTVLPKNLLIEMPVEKWFNPAAPSVKSGEIDPTAYTADEALAMMVEQPLLIRRPLMDIEGDLRAGFEARAVDAWIGLNDSQPKDAPCPSGQASFPHPNPLPEGEGTNVALRTDLDSCRRSEPCPAPEAVT